MEIPQVSRDDFNEIISKHLNSIQDLFKYKNNNYGADIDPLFNFRTAAKNVLFNDDADTMYQVLMVYVEKHLAALRKNLLSDPEFTERCKDIIVYTLIAMAMKDLCEEEVK